MTDKKPTTAAKTATKTKASGSISKAPAKKAPVKRATVKETPAKKAPASAAATANPPTPNATATESPKAEPTKAKAEVDVTGTDAPETKKQDEAAQKTSLSFSGGLQSFLATQNISIAFTSYQSGNFYLIGGGTDGKLSLHSSKYPKAMGIVGDGSRIYLATLSQIVRLENTLSDGQIANGKHDKVYVPRSFQTTGDVDLHEVGICKNGRVVFVNTRYSCLAQFNPKHSFEVLWKPPFISKIVPEDRCHLNGLAMRDGAPKYVTAVCRSDTVDGWRDRRDSGGVIIDIDTNEIMAEGLSMPHSPRWHNGKLWVLNSGSGELGWINPDTKSFEPVAFCPGFVRGLAFHGNYAIMTLSKPRHGRFEGLTLDKTLQDKDADAWCGVQIINLRDGSVAHWVRFDGAIIELFDVCVLNGVKSAMTLPPGSRELGKFVTFTDATQTRLS